MTPKAVKLMALEAARKEDGLLALTVCREIRVQDLYINIPKIRSTNPGRMTIIRYADRPCKAGCGVMMKVGDVAWWEPEWGVSHPECVGREKEAEIYLASLQKEKENDNDRIRGTRQGPHQALR